jgi:hypothetical protein
VWQREHEGGLVVFNFSDSRATVDLPEGYTGKHGEPLSQLTLSSITGDYVIRIE